jgi:hypothetical protein
MGGSVAKAEDKPEPSSSVAASAAAARMTHQAPAFGQRIPRNPRASAPLTGLPARALAESL